MKIIGFIHIYMINHYLEIVQEQLNLMKLSGLYDTCDDIYVGCVGGYTELDKLRELLRDYPKIFIGVHDLCINKYEFLTLNMLKQKSEILFPFYGFYIHTKGVSYIKHTVQQTDVGGKYWRDYMNYYNLTRWGDCMDKLIDGGYDLCGVKLRYETDGPAYELHYSGNFFWFKSEYVKKLVPIDTIDNTNRYEAEMWIGSAEPKAATLCQDFVDYKTKGIFKPTI